MFNYQLTSGAILLEEMAEKLTKDIINTFSEENISYEAAIVILDLVKTKIGSTAIIKIN